jgi:HemY protein
MRKLLLIFVLALFVGAAGIWQLQQGSGYILISYSSTSIEMSLWTGIALYLFFTCLLVWLLLLVRWLSGAGGFQQWWRSRRGTRHASKTTQGLLLYAEHDWQKATQLLSQAADKSVMPEVNLLFAARAAADNDDIRRAQQLLERLKLSYPKSGVAADKLLAELLVVEERFDEALQLIKKLYADKPADRAILRLLSDVYYLTEDWASLEKILRDLKHYGALTKAAFGDLEMEVYSNLVSAFIADPEMSELDQQAKLQGLWDLVPKGLRKAPEMVCAYADALEQVNEAGVVQSLLIKALNNEWQPELLERFGLLLGAAPEKQLMLAEKWLLSHPDDADLLLALGRICRRLEFYGKSRDYLVAAVGLNSCPQAYLELAELLSTMGDEAGSGEMYRNGLLVGLALEV